MPTKEQLDSYYKDTDEHIDNVQNQMIKAIKNLIDRAASHDVSKYSDAEAHIYAKVTPMFKGVPYGTPEHKAVSDLLGPAWEHHQKENDHHTGHHKNGINDMNLMSIIEMLCDWKAASLRDPNQDFKKSCSMNCDKYGANEQLKNIILNTAKELGMI